MEITATNENFAQLIAGDKPVLVDFWATWCGPCRMLAPTVEAVAKAYDGKVCVVKCNVDECEDIAMEYGIRSIPTLLYFKDGKVAERTVGVVPQSDITAKLEALLA